VDLNRLGPGLLHAFLVVAEVGKISEAARRLHLSQPAVTAQIRRLEAELDVPLFIRSVHGVILTPRGAHLQERLQRVFADLEGALSELDQPGELKGVLKFAASTTSAAHFVPNIFARFRRHHPAVGLQLVVGNAKEVLELVREQRVGLGLLRGMSGVQEFVLSSSCPMKLWLFARPEFVIQSFDVRLGICSPLEIWSICR
jgi:DNA-binding transcriptional LysR family regulator